MSSIEFVLKLSMKKFYNFRPDFVLKCGSIIQFIILQYSIGFYLLVHFDLAGAFFYLHFCKIVDFYIKCRKK